MKLLMIAAVAFMLPLMAAAQTTRTTDYTGTLPVYEMFDTLVHPPVFKGGESAMYQFIGENVVYPRYAKKNGIQGTVIIEFLVDAKGKVTNIKALKEVGGGCTEEALRVVKSMPKWTPGTCEGKPVIVRYTLPIKFKLS